MDKSSAGVVAHFPFDAVQGKSSCKRSGDPSKDVLSKGHCLNSTEEKLAVFKTQKQLALLMLAFLVTAGSAQSCWSEEPAPDANEKENLDATLQKLMQERVEVAQQFQQAAQESYYAGTMSLANYIAAQQALAEARYEATQDPKERLQILEALIEMAQKVENAVQRLYQEGRAGGEADKFAEVRLHRINAQIRLIRFKKDNNLD
jgi:hypothetical protein